MAEPTELDGLELAVEDAYNFFLKEACKSEGDVITSGET